MTACVFWKRRRVDNRQPRRRNVPRDVGFGPHNLRSVFFVPATDKRIKKPHGYLHISRRRSINIRFLLATRIHRNPQPMTAWRNLFSSNINVSCIHRRVRIVVPIPRRCNAFGRRIGNCFVGFVGIFVENTSFCRVKFSGRNRFKLRCRIKCQRAPPAVTPAPVSLPPPRGRGECGSTRLRSQPTRQAR